MRYIAKEFNQDYFTEQMRKYVGKECTTHSDIGMKNVAVKFDDGNMFIWLKSALKPIN